MMNHRSGSSLIQFRKTKVQQNLELIHYRILIQILNLSHSSTFFSFYHLISSNLTFSDEIMEEDPKKIKNFTSYLKLLDRKKIILDHNLRKQLIVKQINKVCRIRKLKKACLFAGDQS